MSAIENVSRRRFLTGGRHRGGRACAWCALLLQAFVRRQTSARHKRGSRHITSSVYLGIDPDGTVWIVASRSRWARQAVLLCRSLSPMTGRRLEASEDRAGAR